MSDIRFEGWLHRSGTGGVYQDSAGNVGIASTQPQTRLDIGNGGFQVGPTGIATVTTGAVPNPTPLSVIVNLTTPLVPELIEQVAATPVPPPPENVIVGGDV